MRKDHKHRSENGSVLVVGVFVLATLTAIVASSLNRSMTAAKVSQDSKSTVSELEVKRSVMDMVMLKTKDYAWVAGQSLNDLLPTDATCGPSAQANCPRFKTWYSSTYEGTAYSVSVGDNSDEVGAQDFRADIDKKVYIRTAVTYPTGTRTSQVLMSPGSPAVAGGGEGPGSLPAGVGICYGALNFLTLMSMNAASTISGIDSLPNGWTGDGGCSTVGGCDVAGTATDQYGVATTSWFGTWALGTYFDLGSHSHQGAVIGKAGNLVGGSPPPNNTSYGKPTAQDCANYDNVQTMADNMWAANDPRLHKYQKNFGTTTVAGNLVFGTEAAPEVIYIKTGILGKIVFSGTLSGVGIIIADGNVDFNKAVNWNGVVINDANAIGNIMKFKDNATIYGAMLINRPILSAEIGSVSMDFNFAAGKTADIKYSWGVTGSVLGDLDPNYAPPAGATEGKAFSIASIQDL